MNEQDRNGKFKGLELNVPHSKTRIMMKKIRADWLNAFPEPLYVA